MKSNLLKTSVLSRPNFVAGQILWLANNKIIGRMLMASFKPRMTVIIDPENHFICCCYMYSEMWLSAARLLSADAGAGISCLPYCSQKVW